MIDREYCLVYSPLTVLPIPSLVIFTLIVQGNLLRELGEAPLDDILSLTNKRGARMRCSKW